MPDRTMLKIIGSKDEDLRADMFDIITENKIQMRMISKKKMSSQLHIYEIGEEINNTYLSFSDVELFAESFLNEESNINFPILKNPIKKGNSWINDDIVFEITNTNIEVKTPAGTFNTIEVTNKKTEQTPNESKVYYAKGLGVVKMVHNNITMELIEIDYDIKKFKSSHDVLEHLNKIEI